MRLIFVRHADPDYSIDSLTEKGWKEAELLSRRLSSMDIEAFYCSPLGRARDTASLTLQKMGREAEIFDFLQEFSYPVTDPETGEERHNCWDLMPSRWTEEPAYFERARWMDTPLMLSGHIGAHYQQVAKGIDSILKKHGYTRFKNRYRTEKGNRDTIVVFCHFGVMCVMLSHLLGISPVPLWHGFCAAPSSVTTLYTEREGRRGGFFPVPILWGYGSSVCGRGRPCLCRPLLRNLRQYGGAALKFLVGDPLEKGWKDRLLL